MDLRTVGLARATTNIGKSYFPSCSEAKYPSRVVRADLPFFEGTGYAIGDSIGDVVGYEWDNRDLERDRKRLCDLKKSKIALLPAERLQVLFEDAPVDLNGKTGIAEAVHFTSPAGAKVFSTGSIRSAWGLRKPGFVQEPFRRFDENLNRFHHALSAADRMPVSPPLFPKTSAEQQVQSCKA